MNLNDISTQLLFTTVPIWTEYMSGDQGSATAFIYNYPVAGKENQSLPVLITSHHVLKNAKRAVIEMVERDGDKPNREKRVRIDLPAESLLQNASLELDLAFIPLGAALNQLEAVGRPAFFRSITPDIIPSHAVLDDLAAVEDIVFLGYPSGLRDETNANPLIRRGITSTPVWNSYQGRPTFIIDAGVFPGSSGSPVFILNNGSYATKDGLVVGNRIFFLGMVSHSIVRNESGTQTFLGLGEVLKSSTIRDFVDKHIQPFLTAH